MKIISKITRFAMIAALVLGVSSCDDDDDGGTPDTPATLNIVELAIADTDNLSSLVAALTAVDTQEGVDLIATLTGSTNYTVLAPTNEAFQTFLDDNNYADLSEVPLEVLTMVLKNHVIEGTVEAADLAAEGAGYTTTLADAGPDGNLLSIYYNTADGVEFNGVSSVIDADIAATNGVVHVVDAVIGLPDVTTFATADTNFSSLVEGLTAYNFTYVSTLQGEGPFTVFAPDNAAFDALLATNDDWNAPGDIDELTLGGALTLHVITDANVRAADLTDGDVTTLGGDVTIDATAATITDGSDPAVVSTITATDVQATNGVIHMIDTVLLTPLQ
ncbi:fasciclin domain-containing protein [Aquimarina addita]|uniref:Fasciclin domain-containing protein n=1 Tax=Aquimarina addita TaxID=870485 RepID=A0ABP6ULB2_9FLAO